MNPALVALAALTIGGAVLAVATRDVRNATLGLLIVLLGSALIADPMPSPGAILARVTAALLATRFLMIGLRGGVPTGGTRIGWPTEALVAAAAGVVGFGSHGLGAEGLGPAEAQAAGFAIVAVALTPLLTGRDVIRIGIGAVLLIVGAGLIRNGLAAPLSDGEHLVEGLLAIGVGGALAVIATAARAAGRSDSDDPDGGRRRRLPDAHRPSDAERTRTRVPRTGSRS